MIRNTHRVPLKQWRHWSEHARGVFNSVYSAMIAEQDMFLHPKAKAARAEHWSTTAWNAAWIAAEATDLGSVSVESVAA